MKQRTIQNNASISGVGIHTGASTNVTLIPAKANSGIRFIRTDLSDNPIIEASVDNVSSTERSTDLKQGNAEIKTIEHLLAAVSGANIDNLIIEVDNIEIPILDGSSKEFSELIANTGIIDLSEDRKYFEIKRKISFKDEKTGTTLTATPADEYQIEVEIDYNSKILGIQHANLQSISDFNNEISSSRTFCFLHELEALIENNLIKGGDLNNAIVVVEKEIEQDKLDKLAYLHLHERVLLYYLLLLRIEHNQ